MNKQLFEQLSRITSEEQAILSGSTLQKALYTDRQDFTVDYNRLLEKGRLITLRPHTRFIFFPEHQHNYIEIMYMVAGTTTHTINRTQRITLQKGELLMMNQHASHAIDIAQKEDVAVNMIVMPSFFDAVTDTIGMDNVLSHFLINALRQTDADVSYLHFRVAEIHAIQSVMESMLATLAEDEKNNHRLNQVAMTLLFLHLLNHTDKAITQRKDFKQNAIALSAIKEIEENYANANLSQIATHFGVSLSYLSRTIKETTGRSYTSTLQHKRLSKAASLLKNTTLTIADIMDAVGYHNSSYFYALFEKHFGQSPRDYRKGSKKTNS